MNEIKVDWKLAPVDATELVNVPIGGQRWRNAEKLQYWEMNGDFAGYYSKNSPLDEAKVLATRSQRKTVAGAVEKEDEKLTHTCNGNECKLLAGKHDLFNRMPIQYKSGEYGLVHISDLKPIEPKLTKEQSETLIKFSSEVGSLEITAEVESYLKKYS